MLDAQGVQFPGVQADPTGDVFIDVAVAQALGIAIETDDLIDPGGVFGFGLGFQSFHSSHKLGLGPRPEGIEFGGREALVGGLVAQVLLDGVEGAWSFEFEQDGRCSTGDVAVLVVQLIDEPGEGVELGLFPQSEE